MQIFHERRTLTHCLDIVTCTAGSLGSRLVIVDIIYVVRESREFVGKPLESNWSSIFFEISMDESITRDCQCYVSNFKQ